MTATYDPTDLVKTTDAGRINVVRFLLGDTDVTSPELQNEEIAFTLTEVSNQVYQAASLSASAVASKYAGLANIEIDGILSADYGELSSSFSVLAVRLKADGSRLDGASLGIFVGGLPTPPARSYAFYRGQFQNPNEVNDLDGY